MNYKKIFIILLAIFFGFTFYNEQPTVALITSVEGEITLIRNGKNESPALGTELYKDDVLKAGKKGKAIVYFMDGSMLVLNPNESLTFGNDFTSTKIGTGNSSRALVTNDIDLSSASNLSTTQKREIAQAILTPPAFRGYGVIPILPSGFTAETDPIFVWVDSTDAGNYPEEREYVLIVLDEDLNEILRETVKGKTLVFNRYQLKGKLKSGDGFTSFYWDIYIKGKEPKKDSQYEVEGAFKIVSTEKVEQVKIYMTALESELKSGKIDQTTFNFLSGLYLKSNKLYNDAILRFESILSSGNNSKNIIEELAFMYTKLGKNSSLMVGFYKKML